MDWNIDANEPEDPELAERWRDYWRNSDPKRDLQERFEEFWALENDGKPLGN